MVCRTYLHPQSTRTASQSGPCVWTSRRCTRSEHIRTGAASRTTARCGYSGLAHGERTLALIPIPLWNRKRNVLITPLVYVVIDTPSWTLPPTDRTCLMPPTPMLPPLAHVFFALDLLHPGHCRRARRGTGSEDAASALPPQMSAPSRAAACPYPARSPGTGTCHWCRAPGTPSVHKIRVMVRITSSP